MIRFQPGHKLAEHFYARQDGTRTFFFTLEHINSLFTDPFPKTSTSTDENTPTVIDISTPQLVLFTKSTSEYVFRETVNVKENLRVPRVFIQSKFTRTDSIC